MLTDTALKRAPRKKKPYNLTDERGLYIVINPDGRHYWRMRYSFGGKRNTLSLGTYPATPLADARKRRDAIRSQIEAGTDPSAARKLDKAATIETEKNRFEAVAREWLAVKRPEWAPSHYAKEELRLVVHAFPWIGSKPFGDLDVDHVRPLLERVIEAGHIEQANRLREQLSRISRYAIATGRAKFDHAHALSELIPRRISGGMPALVKPDQIGELLRAIDGYGGSLAVKSALRLAPYLFCRPGELRMTEWTHIHDLDGEHPEIHVPPENRKIPRLVKQSKKPEEGYQPHIVPLPHQAVTILRELQPLTGRRQHVFPNARKPLNCMSEAAVNAALHAIGFKGLMVGHGFRHMASTRLEEMGFPDTAIEAQLSHKIPGVRGRYKRDEYLRFLAQRRQMMQAWADYLDALRTRSTVVALRAA